MNTFFKFFGLLFAISLAFWVINVFFYGANKAVTQGPTRYEEYEEIYQTCEQISQDICNIKDVPTTDKMFEQFSKEQRLNALRTKMNRWTTDYNGKSRMITRSMWKSGHLPQTLSATDFPCR